MLNDISNGSHRENREGYFEWWYFHFTTDGNISVNLVLHETDIFGVITEPYLSISFFQDTEEPVYRKRKILPIKNEVGNNFLSIADNGVTIQETKEKVMFSLDFSDLHFSGEIKKLSPPISINNSVLYENDKTKDKSCWTIQIPHATFDGKIIISEKVFEISGMAYQDHNWGFLQIQDFVSDWAWGHFSNNNISMAFYRILTNDNKTIDRIALITPDNTLADSIVHTNFLDYLISNDEPEKTQCISQLDIPQNTFQFSIPISQNKLMRSRIKENHQAFTATYCRWSASASINKDGFDHIVLSGITEYIRIRRD